MAEVRIDGVLYVPVSEAHIDAERITGALLAQWWGEGWENHMDALAYLRVVVSDTFETNKGDTIPEFVARILAAIR